jgi:hypothetical protein
LDDNRRRIGSAHVLALLALFAALATGAYAAKQAAKNSVTSRSVRNGSLTGTDVKNDSLTGKDVKESTLGLVPSAQSAQSAQSAMSAQSFDGVKKIDFRDNQTNQTQTILSFRGMELRATCAPISGPATEVRLDLQTTPAATVNSSMMRANEAPGSDPSERSNESSPGSLIVRGGALSAGGTIAVIPGTPSNDSLADPNLANKLIQGEGQIVYRSDSDVVTVNYHAFVDHTASSSNGYCEILGNAVAQ